MAVGNDDGTVGAARPYTHGIQRRRVEVPVLQIGIDIGGTFTDCVLIGDPAADGTAAYRTAKALSR